MTALLLAALLAASPCDGLSYAAARDCLTVRLAWAKRWGWRPLSAPWNPDHTALTCTRHDPEAAERWDREHPLVRFTTRRGYEPSCVRCLARGRDGKPVGLDPRVCDSLSAQFASAWRYTP